MKDVEKLESFIALMASKPSMVVGADQNPLDRIQAFLLGLYWARELRESHNEEWIDAFFTFESWLAKRMFDSEDPVAWFEGILESSGGDQRLAYEKFLEYFQHYLQEQSGD